MKQQITAKEETIMKLFWEKGEMCIRELYDSLNPPKPGYTTISKQVGFLEEKGLLTRRPLANLFLYKATVSEKDYHSRSIGDVVRKYYDSSYPSLVLQFVEEKKMNLEELKEIIDLIEKNH